ncbi:Hypothetical protein FKW44_013517 [Caligus rogercresseyi]|uniref:Uncharacterized protein n=1 Tax=Caligus rogercresseyi TaxID=217165 RepID=A0A7T8GXM7_CALRO|nr:Hypothetical protein FKW44_013517 [Caligus rogercresseyi]
MWKANWLKMSSCRQTKHFISEPYLGKKMYHYRRTSMTRIVSMASGHINLNGHLHRMGRSKTPTALSARRKMKLRFISSTIVHRHGLEWTNLYWKPEREEDAGGISFK